MKKIIFAIAALFASHLAFAANALEGKVVGVADGDTITVLDASKNQHRIRLTGIDAPEKSQAFGEKSKQNLSKMVYGKQVAVLWDKKDRYDRILGKVLTDWGDVNLAQVEDGMAWHYKRYMNDQSMKDQLAYDDAERTARRLKKGLWADAVPTPPWDWRRR